MSVKSPPRIGVMLGPHFVRMAGSFGYMKGYFKDYSLGRIPKPYNIVGVSSGSVVGAVTCPFTQKVFTKAEQRLTHLRGGDFYGQNKNLMLWGGVEALGPLALFLPWEKIRSGLLRNIAKGTAILGMELAEEQFIEHLFSVNGMFSNYRLFKLMMEFLDFPGIYNSGILLDLVAANLNGNILDNSNVAPHIVTNYKPEHMWQNEILAEGVRQSTSIPGFFETHKNDYGESITDGGIYSAFPIEIPYNHGCDVIVIVELNYAGQGYLNHDYSKWTSAIHRALDITVDDKHTLVLRGCRNMNNDLEKIKSMEAAISGLESISKDLPARQKEAVNQQIVNLQQAIAGLTAYGKNFFNLVVVKSRREIPEFNFRSFDEKYMKMSIDIGEEAYMTSRDEIYRAIDRLQ
ncbi:MAG: hypothetical protein A3J46_06575 [Candidatus Yanofskybacteria bacterium RIFCSPHIGHO2_02_FULL_41_11]|uniref:PNPLA domain-containing protein n=1 Tax=Candidatus Yanofskybacteria bacterium RIFCSPHIGHO2_02_FULL_41_11 TaxID=1802675 RepID=A0A1F8F7W5_9BACT|nr:MAG: hypothetical protein A3J46_06575 [Candidatus Yanofskybacteria bacterium RIFCSPHIGHO2_02_FULL_41_11]